MLKSFSSLKVAILLACVAAETTIEPKCVCAEPQAESSALVTWRTSIDFQRQLARPIGLAWRGDPLWSALTGLARSQRVAIFLDRRIDPGRKIDFSVRDVSLEEALRQLATDHELGFDYVGAVIYLGPRATTSKLSALMTSTNDRLARLPLHIRRNWLHRHRWQWPVLTEPRQLIEQLAQDARIEIQGTEKVPHDLWPATDLPPLTLAQRLTLVVTGFDLTFEFLGDGRAVRLVPIPAELTMRRTYTVPGNTRELARKLAQICPHANVTIGRSALVIVASSEDHAKIKAYLTERLARTTTHPNLKKRFSVRVVNQSADALIGRVAAELGLNVRAEPKVAGKLRETVTLKVTQATRDELLEATLKPLGLAHEVRENDLIIHLSANGDAN